MEPPPIIFLDCVIITKILENTLHININMYVFKKLIKSNGSFRD